MKVFYSDAPLDLDLNKESMFLAGPTPRSLAVKSWRILAIQLLESFGYNGQVIVPERSVPKEHIDYIEQTEWENYGTEKCSILVFWVPRQLKDMPGFTTNVEFGRYVESGKVLYGRPTDAVKTRYLDWLYQKFNTHPIHTDLEELLRLAAYKNVKEQIDKIIL